MTQQHPFTIAAFDFDGTITKRDALVSFLIHSFGLSTTLYKGICLVPAFLNYLFNRLTRQQIKETILTAYFKGIPEEHMQQLAQTFSTSKGLQRLLRPEALRRIYWHRSQGHHLFIVSAAIQNYLNPWAKSMGFEDVIASRLEITPQGTITGHLNGLNCWGPEKVRRLKEVLGSKENWILYAYGDSRGDKELLEFADYPFLNEMPKACLIKH